MADLETKVSEGWKHRITKLPGTLVELAGFGFVNLGEQIRASYVNPNSGYAVFYKKTRPQEMVPQMSKSDNPALYDFLQHMGDWWEGYYYSCLIYNGLTYLFPRSSEKLRLGISLGVTNAAIFTAESGVLGNRPDYPDIPAGVFGSLLFMGAHYLGKFITQRLLANNQKFLRLHEIDSIEKYL